MSKGSKRRPTEVSEKQFQDNWEKVFGKKEPKVKVRKQTPKHAQSKVHKDKTKVIPRKKKYSDIGPKYEGPWGKYLGLS